jgi:hypothetical protein
MDVLPSAHANVLIYLISFLQQIFESATYLENPEAKRRIVRAFAKVLMRGPSDRKSNDLRRKEAVLWKLIEE